MKKAMVAGLVVGLFASMSFGAGDITSVASYAAPNLVSEINTALGQADTRLDAVEGGALASPVTATAATTATAVFIGADAAGAADTRFDTTGAGAITVGSADVTSITLTTDGSGDAEVVLPNQSVGNAELADDAVGADELAADAVVKASLSAADFGDFTADADGTCTLDADVVAAAEMADADHGDVAWSGGVATVQAAPAAGLTGDVLLSSVTNLLSTGTLATNVFIDLAYTNTVILRTLTTGVIVVDSWTQVAVGE
jgi:hypothetical protein